MKNMVCHSEAGGRRISRSELRASIRGILRRCAPQDDRRDAPGGSGGSGLSAGTELRIFSNPFLSSRGKKRVWMPKKGDRGSFPGPLRQKARRAGFYRRPLSAPGRYPDSAGRASGLVSPHIPTLARRAPVTNRVRITCGRVIPAPTPRRQGNGRSPGARPCRPDVGAAICRPLRAAFAPYAGTEAVQRAGGSFVAALLRMTGGTRRAGRAAGGVGPYGQSGRVIPAPTV